MAKFGLSKVHRYSMYFITTAVRLSELPELIIQDVAEALDIHPFMLSRWRKQAREGLSVTMWKYLVAWFVMLLVSVANGAIRDFTYGRHINELAAHQLSTISSVVLLGLVIWGYVRIYPPASRKEAIFLGLLWMALTVAFEFVFFHYVGGHSWTELRANYNVLEGRVWVVVLLWLAIAPYLFYRFRRGAPRK